MGTRMARKKEGCLGEEKKEEKTDLDEGTSRLREGRYEMSGTARVRKVKKKKLKRKDPSGERGESAIRECNRKLCSVTGGWGGG